MTLDELKADITLSPGTENPGAWVAATYREAGVDYECDVHTARMAQVKDENGAVIREYVAFDAVVYVHPSDRDSSGAMPRGRNGLVLTPDGAALELPPVG